MMNEQSKWNGYEFFPPKGQEVFYSTEWFAHKSTTGTSTLLKYDIVNLDASVQKELLESIDKEGILLYEKV